MHENQEYFNSIHLDIDVQTLNKLWHDAVEHGLDFSLGPRQAKRRFSQIYKQLNIRNKQAIAFLRARPVNTKTPKEITKH